MPSDSFNDILKRAKGLSADEQQQLIDALSRREASSQNGQPRTLGECMEARGMFGMASGPSDLSSNPKYMEGFGEDG